MSAQPRPQIAPLQAGDRLSVAEFERRYEAMPHIKKAELIEGVVYMPSPVSQRDHGEPHLLIAGWLAHYLAYTPGVEGGDNATVKLRVGLNQPQPDAFLRIRPDHGGQSQTESGYVVGPPELVVEVTASRASYDLHDKLGAYERNGVREYLVWRVQDRALDWLRNQDGKFKPMRPDRSGILASEVFPGLWLDMPALLDGDLAKVLATLGEGLATKEHERFVARLNSAKKPGKKRGGP